VSLTVDADLLGERPATSISSHWGWLTHAAGDERAGVDFKFSRCLASARRHVGLSPLWL